MDRAISRADVKSPRTSRSNSILKRYAIRYCRQSKSNKLCAHFPYLLFLFVSAWLNDGHGRGAQIPGLRAQSRRCNYAQNIRKVCALIVRNVSNGLATHTHPTMTIDFISLLRDVNGCTTERSPHKYKLLY